MKVFVNNLPNKPEECLFYKKEYSRDSYSDQLHVSCRCSMNGALCDLEKGHRCNKLKCIF